MECPNKCGDLVFIKKPIRAIYMLPLEVLECVPPEYQDDRTSLIAVCPECGFGMLTEVE